MAKHFIGVDLGGTNVRAGLVSGGKLLKLTAQTIRSQGSEGEVFEDLCAAIDSVFDRRVKGLGVGVPSLVEQKTGTILDTVNIPSWKKVPLKKRLEKKYRVPVFLDNDANCFALGERYFGQGKACDNFVGLITGTGLGSGIIARGKLISGQDCGAGEFGMLPYRDSILEHYASGQFFTKFNWDGATLAAEAAGGNAKALEIFNEYGKHLAYAVKAILYALAPEMIILGGSVSQSYKYYEKSLHEGLADFGYPSLTRKLKIRTSKLKDVAVLGAASLVVDQK
ncbi:MAG: ROK family protein [Bdellovibrionales bacterium]